MKVICFGDSNTYGYDPRGFFGGRYEAASRWVDILASDTGWTVCNMGQNGREIPSAAPAFPDDTDLLIAPPPMALGEWVPSQQLIDDSYTFAQCCRSLADQMGIRFADAGKWGIPLAYDGVHFTEQGHKAFAAGLLEELR